MKFLYCSDIHAKLINPINRIDNYGQSILLKIDEIIQLSIKYKCDFVIVGGDIGDTPHMSLSLIDELLDRIESCSIPWRIVVGNHDEIGANWENSKSSALYHMFRRSKLVDRLTTIETNEYYIKGMDYFYGIEEDIKNNGLIHNSKSKFTICIPHALINLSKFFEGTSYVVAKDIKTNYDLILCSHLHMNFDKTIKNTRFLNLNSIGRSSIKEQHRPQIAIIDTNTQNIEVIPLKSAKTPEECFDLSKVAEEKNSDKALNSFLEKIENFNFQSIDFRDRIYEFAKMNKEEDEVVNNIIQRLNKLGDKK